MAVFGGVEDVHQLAGRDVLEPPAVCLGVSLCEVLVEGAVRLAEEDARVRRRRSVAVQFYKRPLGPAQHMDVLLEPQAHPVGARRVGGGEVGVFEAREEAELAPLPVQRERALNDEQVAEDGC